MFYPSRILNSIYLLYDVDSISFMRLRICIKGSVCPFVRPKPVFRYPTRRWLPAPIPPHFRCGAIPAVSAGANGGQQQTPSRWLGPLSDWQRLVKKCPQKNIWFYHHMVKKVWKGKNITLLISKDEKDENLWSSLYYLWFQLNDLCLWLGWRTDGRTDRQTDRQTDGWTDTPSYRNAWSYLKIHREEIELHFFLVRSIISFKQSSLGAVFTLPACLRWTDWCSEHL